MTGKTLRALLVAAAALLLVPGVTQACIEPSFVVYPNVAGPGDTMHYTISGLTASPDAQAEWVISTGGQRIASGSASGGTVTGTFPMPALGDRSTGFSFEAAVEHLDIENGAHTEIPSDRDGFYRPPASAPGGDQDAKPAPATPPVSAPGDRAGGGKRPSGPPRGDDRARGLTQTPRSTRPALPPAPQVDATVPSAQRISVTAEHPVHAIARSDRHGVLARPDRHRTTRTEPARAPIPERALPQPQSEAASVPTARAAARRAPPVPLWLVAVLTIGGVCAGVLMFLRRHGGEAAAAGAPPLAPRIPPDLLLEAELQEIVAEERHKRLREEHDREPAEAGEPIRAGPI